MTLPAIPPIIDAPRSVSVTATPGTELSTIDVTFPLFGAQEDLTVFVGDSALSTADWTFTSPSGQLTLLPLPITDGVVTFTPPITVTAPTIVIVQGSWQPRQIMVPQAPGIPRREFNQQYSTIIAGMRDLLDRINSISSTTPTLPVPSNLALPVISGIPQVGDILTATNGTWSGSPTSFAFQWLNAGSPISGAISSTYAPQTSDIGDLISVEVTATNATGSGTPATSAQVGPVTAAGVAPANTVLPAISGTPQVGDTLTASNGTWTGSPTSFTFQWLLGGSPISGATGSTFVPVTGDVGGMISVTVTATNATGSTPATSTTVGPVTAAPANTVLPAISGTAQVGQTLTATDGTWTGSPTSFAFQWLSAGSPISGATSSTYVPVTGDVGNLITVTVTATNATGSTPATSSGVGPVTAASGPSLDFSQASNSQNLL